MNDLGMQMSHAKKIYYKKYNRHSGTSVIYDENGTRMTIVKTLRVLNSQHNKVARLEEHITRLKTIISELTESVN